MAPSELLVVGSAAFLVFANTLPCGFVWDDRGAILNNMDTRSDGTPLASLLEHDFWGMNLSLPTSHKSFRPLTVLSFRVNHALDGLNPWGYHLVNVFLHSLTSILVLLTGRVLCAPYNDTRAPILASLLFAVHPIHCDSVASIVGRADILCTALCLWAFLIYHPCIKLPGFQIWPWFAASTLIFLATLAKELGVTMFGVLLVVEFSSPSSISRRLALLCSAFAMVAWRVWMNGPQTIYKWSVYENEFVHLPSATTRALSYAHVHALYLWKLVWPHNLCYDYGWNTIDAVSSLSDVRNCGTAFAYLAVLAVVVSSLTRASSSPQLAMCTLALCPFVPASHIFFPIGTILAERLLYFPSVGVCLLLGWTFDQALTLASTRSMRFTLKTLLAILLVLGAWRAIRRNMDWRDEATLFGSAIDVAPTSVKVLTNLGQVLFKRKPGQAAMYLERAVALMPEYSLAHLNLAATYGTLNKPLHAMAHLLEVVALEDSPQAFVSLGQRLLSFWESHQSNHSTTLPLAVKLVQRVLDSGAIFPSAYYTKAALEFAQSRYDSAIEWLAATMNANSEAEKRGNGSEERVAPCQIQTMLALAWEHLNATHALSMYKRSLPIAQFDSDSDLKTCLSFANNAAACFYRQGLFTDALDLIERATKIHRDSSVLWANGGYAAEALRRFDVALIYFEAARTLDPEAPHLAAKVHDMRLQITRLNT
ncbi:hypothetical protein Ae201684P_009829 [Aphanomyces euteiches]|nr:hypothetical protein Ae201684P_009829 [Aphanomyces euteiches]